MPIFKKEPNVVGSQELHLFFVGRAGRFAAVDRSLVVGAGCRLELRRVRLRVSVLLVSALIMVSVIAAALRYRLWLVPVFGLLRPLVRVVHLHCRRGCGGESWCWLWSFVRDFAGSLRFFLGVELGPDIAHLPLLIGGEFVGELEFVQVLSFAGRPLRLFHVNKQTIIISAEDYIWSESARY